VIVKSNPAFGKNNFDLLRLMLASAVFLFHLPCLTNFSAFSLLSNLAIAQFAVRSFFVISGILIYRSYVQTPSVSRYFEKRFRRIYPAYGTVIVLLAVGLSLLSTLSFRQYFGLGFLKYLGANLLFLNFLAPSLPGVFTGNYETAVNGALWTLKVEVAFYLFVPILYSLCKRFGPKTTVAVMCLLSLMWQHGMMLLDFVYKRRLHLPGDSRSVFRELSNQFPAQMIYFCVGILLYLYFDKLVLHMRSVAVVTVALFAVDLLWTRGQLNVLWVAGFVFVFGFGRYLGNFSKYGDFSYGVYIVHSPIMQILIACGVMRFGPAVFFLASLFLIALCSVLMWHLVESRFLSRGSHYKNAGSKPEKRPAELQTTGKLIA